MAAWRFVTDLGTLPGGASSFPIAINPRGQVTGQAQNGLIDPLTGFPAAHAVVWQHGDILDLGTLGGYQSLAAGIDDRGQVVGGPQTAILDPLANDFALEFLFVPAATQVHAFRWQGGALQDLGTLGGPDSYAQLVNNRGQIVGASYTNSIAGPTGIPRQDPFLWEDGKMISLGTLGGTFGFPTGLNNRGQIAGRSNQAGDQTFHPFLWENGSLKDLGTFGGVDGSANGLNDAGEVVGFAEYAIPCDACAEPGNQVYYAALWRNTAIADLGTVKGDRCSNAFSINSRTQVVGSSGICHGAVHAFLWEDGGPMIDLNTRIAPGSGLQLVKAININDSGEIAGIGVLPNGDTRAILLIPCEGGPETAGCKGDSVEKANDQIRNQVAPDDRRLNRQR